MDKSFMRWIIFPNDWLSYLKAPSDGETFIQSFLLETMRKILFIPDDSQLEMSIFALNEEEEHKEQLQFSQLL